MIKKSSEIYNFDNDFWEIDFQVGTCLTLAVKGKSEKNKLLFSISLIEEMFLIFVPCFFDSLVEYAENNFGQYIVPIEIKEIITRLKKIESFLIEDGEPSKDLIKYFSRLNPLYVEFEYLKYVNENKVQFQIATLQLREWLEKCMCNIKDPELLIYGY